MHPGIERQLLGLLIEQRRVIAGLRTRIAGPDDPGFRDFRRGKRLPRLREKQFDMVIKSL